MPKIENDYLKVEINELGGCFKSIYDKKNNDEILYQPNGTSWSGQDVVIFPVIGALKNHKYMVDGKEYTLKNHGIIRYEMVKYNVINDEDLEIYYDYNERSLKLYPYRFKLTVRYKLEDNKIIISYNVKNEDDKEMYFSLGGHPALKATGRYVDNHFDFENTYCTFLGIISKQYTLNDSGDQITGSKTVNITGKYVLDKNDIEKNKTLIYDASNLKQVTLYTNGYEYIFDVSKAPIIAIWSMKNTGNFICIEPWWGLPDNDNPYLELKNKNEIIKLNKNEEYHTGYSILINKL